MYQPISLVNVCYQGFGAKRLIGKLTMDGRRPAFGYDAAWLADGLELSLIERCHYEQRLIMVLMRQAITYADYYQTAYLMVGEYCSWIGSFEQQCLMLRQSMS